MESPVVENSGIDSSTNLRFLGRKMEKFPFSSDERWKNYVEKLAIEDFSMDRRGNDVFERHLHTELNEGMHTYTHV